MGTKTTISILFAWFLLLSGWEPWEGRFPGDHRLSSDGLGWIWHGQVCDGRTGRPVPDCAVRVYSEFGRVVLDGDCTPAGEGRSDDDGLVSMLIRREPKPTIWVYEAEGYAPLTVVIHDPPGKPGDAVVGLFPGRDFRGRVVDPLGRPCPGVRVSCYGGCRHAPAHRRAESDADGRFVLTNVEVTQLWIEGPGVAAGYGDYLVDEHGDALVLAQPGITASGRILDREGKPLKGVWVRGPWSRGPGVRTDGEGCFVLPGIAEGEELCLSTDTLPEVNGVVTSTPATRGVVRDPRPFRLRFDPSDASMVWPGDERIVTLELPGHEGLNRVTLIHRETGETFVEEWRDGPGKMEVPAGPHEVRIGGPFTSCWYRTFEDEFENSRPLLKPKPYACHDLARLRLEVTGLPEDASLLLKDAEGDAREVAAGEEVQVPADTPLALRVVFATGRAAFFPIAPVTVDEEQPARRGVELAPLAELAFRLPPGIRLRDFDFDLVAGDPDGLERDLPVELRGGAIVIPVRDGRTRYLRVVRTANDEEVALVPVPQPFSPGEVRDLGVLSLEPPRIARALVADDRGRPLEGLSVAFLGRSDDFFSFFPGLEVAEEGEGRYRHDRRLPVNFLRVSGRGRITVLKRVEGFGPFTVTLSSASVTVKLPYGTTAGVLGLLDGYEMQLDEEARTLSLSGVPAGTHRLKLRAPDGSHWQREFTLEESEERVLEAP